MTWADPKPPREVKGWIIEILYGSMGIAALIGSVVLLGHTITRLEPIAFIMLAAAITALAAMLLWHVDAEWFPHLATGAVVFVGFCFALMELVVLLSLPFEILFVVTIGLALGLSSGSTGTVDERNLKLVSPLGTELRWSLATFVIALVLFQYVVPAMDRDLRVIAGIALLLAALMATWRLPKAGTPHVAIAMMAGIGVMLCGLAVLEAFERVRAPIWIAISMFLWLYRKADEYRDARFEAQNGEPGDGLRSEFQ